MAVLVETFVLAILFISATGHANRNLVLGGAVNIFKFFGDLTVTMRVDPRNDSDPDWLFRDPPPPVFHHSIKHRKWNDAENPAGQFRVELCDDLSELYRAFFRGIRIEGLAKDWEAFTGSWTKWVARNKLGIPEELLDRDYSYVFVEVSTFIESATLTRHTGLTPTARLLAASVTPQDTPSVLGFIQRLGTHYISSYVLGNSLFQVLVFEKARYERLKAGAVKGGADNLGGLGAGALEMGRIRCRSGGGLEGLGPAGVRLAERLGGDLSALERRPRLLGAVARLLPAQTLLLKLRLKSLEALFDTSPPDRRWFREVVRNRLVLYELNS